MRVVAIHGKGGPEVFRIEERPSPSLGPEELRVRVHASALNRADLLQARGHYPAPPGFPEDIPGLEYSGEVIEVGARARRFKKGDRVMGLVGGGGFSEEVITHEREALAVPSSFNLDSAAAIPEAFLTAFDALVVQGGLRAGEHVLIHAVTSGVGSAGAQIARAFGAHVIGTGRTPEKLARAREWGVAETITVGSPPRFAERTRELTKGHGIDLVLDLVSGDYLGETIRALAPRGRVIAVGLLGGGSSELPLGLVLQKRAMLLGTVLRSRPLEEKIALARRFEAECLPLLANGTLKPVIDEVVAMTDIRAAAERMADNATVGKLVLRW